MTVVHFLTVTQVLGSAVTGSVVVAAEPASEPSVLPAPVNARAHSSSSTHSSWKQELLLLELEDELLLEEELLLELEEELLEDELEDDGLLLLLEGED